MAADEYLPVDCGFHDQIEALATLRRRVALTFAGSSGQGFVEGVIRDIWTTAGKEEFLRMDDGTEVRLDRILSLRRADSGA